MSNAKGANWDMTSYFPEFNGAEMQDFKRALAEGAAQLQSEAAGIGTLTGETAAQWEGVMLKTEEMYARLTHMFSYITCLRAADAMNEAYSQELAQLMRIAAEFEKYEVDVLHAFKAATAEDFEAFVAREALAPIAHPIRKTREKALYTMSREEEKLAADLNLDGFHSWGRLYELISSKLEFEMVYPDGKREIKPISQWRSLMSDVNREIGKAAFECGNKAWAGMEDVCAATLNAIAGTRLTLNKYRGIDNFLHQPLFQASIKRESLDAMYKAIYDNVETAREIFRAKGGFFGRKGIAWYEREAPLDLKDTKRYEWAQGSDMVAKSFAQVYPKLADYYNDALAKRWVESEPRAGKVPGAFCTGSPINKEQRVYMTFSGSLSDVGTLAHEFGHAYHSYLLRNMRPMAQDYPMTLAETASIFAEHILADGIYADNSIADAQKLLMLDNELCGAAVLLLDITVRFEFEKAFHEERAQGEVSVTRFKELMVETQRRVWGDALIEGSEDPMFWASKLHFYITGVSFYNFPYTFGFLLARALANLFHEQGAAFLPKYEEFLMLTGSDTVENVVSRTIGEDTTKPEFWAKSIKSLEAPLARYRELLKKAK
jgi:oligoendopeptidase F